MSEANLEKLSATEREVRLGAIPVQNCELLLCGFQP
jgi:hypothetical protein